jgi:hypothetical protein
MAPDLTPSQFEVCRSWPLLQHKLVWPREETVLPLVCLDGGNMWLVTSARVLAFPSQGRHPVSNARHTA